ncbi:hypothetical protein M569_04616 [Genlisea aurea]|uniref:Reverse transcriptase Ty1/copia-type domain-containing protein n=1 Tax=Genlisea aurea TaxID=192259 RepID=S8CTH0_9LAMI|nr:hypothetical protein M569_04616 [Genlisea aurea]
MEKEISEAFVFSPNAQAMWDEIDRRFGVSVEPQIFHLRGELQSLHQGDDSVVVYFTKLKSIWNQLDSLRPLPPLSDPMGLQLRAREDSDRLQQFLFGLKSEYTSLKNQIIASRFPLDEAYRLVLTCERQNGVSQGAVSNSFMVGQHPPVSSQDAEPNQSKKRPKCTYCKRVGHLRENCWKLHGRPDASKRISANLAASSQTAQGVSPSSIPQDFINLVQTLWTQIQNQGAPASEESGDADECEPAEFTGMTPLADFKVSNSDTKVFLPNNSSLKVSGRGIFRFRSGLLLSDVLKDRGSNAVVAEGYVRNGLYYLPDTAMNKISSCSVSLNKPAVDLRIWHSRFGHASPFVLRKIPALNKLKDSVSTMALNLLILRARPYFVKQAPDFSHLRIFGCLVYASDTTPNKDKFAPRTIPAESGETWRYKLPDDSIASTSELQHIESSIVNPRVSDAIFPSQPSESLDDGSDAERAATVVAGIRFLDATRIYAARRGAVVVAGIVTIVTGIVTIVTGKHRLCSTFFSTATTTSLAFGFLYPRWIEAMNVELDALNRNETWEICSLPKGKRAIGCRWVYKTKVNPDGSINKRKARLVAQGYGQKEGVDFTDVFAPVAKITTVRLFIAMAAHRSWPLQQLDVNNAFLHGTLDEEVYMKIPQGCNDATGSQHLDNGISNSVDP